MRFIECPNDKAIEVYCDNLYLLQFATDTLSLSGNVDFITAMDNHLERCNTCCSVVAAEMAIRENHLANHDWLVVTLQKIVINPQRRRRKKQLVNM